MYAPRSNNWNTHSALKLPLLTVAFGLSHEPLRCPHVPLFRPPHRVVALKRDGIIAMGGQTVTFDNLCFIDQTKLGNYEIQFFFPGALPKSTAPIEVTDKPNQIKLCPTDALPLSRLKGVGNPPHPHFG